MFPVNNVNNVCEMQLKAIFNGGAWILNVRLVTAEYLIISELCQQTFKKALITNSPNSQSLQQTLLSPISINKEALYEFHCFFKLISRSSHRLKSRNDEFESIAARNQIEKKSVLLGANFIFAHCVCVCKHEISPIFRFISVC